jgi:hypothetical protein
MRRARTEPRKLQKRHGFDPGNIESLPASHIPTLGLVIKQHHITLRLREPGTIALVSPARQAGFLGSDHPFEIVGFLSPAPGAVQYDGLSRLRFGIERSLVHAELV